ncbi:MAG: hypothetical protein KDA29_09230 [Phycisphaerales bacterium]|nr:hypothetical protein [Phycisphaerales bacterium]
MILILLIMMMAAVLLLCVGINGRVIARGHFCPRCEYDLEVIRDQLPFARCPECGFQFDPGVSPTTERREHRKWLFAIAIVIVLIPIGVGASQSRRWKTTIYPRLPDGVIVSRAIERDSIAFDELMSRALARPDQEQLHEASWKTIIEHAIELLRPWEPFKMTGQVFVDHRWAQLLAHAINTRRLSEEQLLEYVTEVMKYKVVLPSRIATDSEEMYYKALHNTGVAIAGNIESGQDEYIFDISLIELGVVGEDAPVTLREQVFRMGLLATGPGTDTVPEVPSHGAIDGVQSLLEDKELGVFKFYTRSRITIIDGVTNETIAWKDITTVHPCELVSHDAAVPASIEDPEVNFHYCDWMDVGKLNLHADTHIDQLPSEGEPVMSIGVSFPTRDIDYGIALDVLVRLGDETLFLGSCVRSPLFQDHYPYRAVTLFAPPMGSPERVRLKAFMDNILDAGRVEVVLRTNPERAIGYPGIEQVVDFNANFRDVGLTINKANMRPHPYYGYKPQCEI